MEMAASKRFAQTATEEVKQKKFKEEEVSPGSQTHQKMSIASQKAFSTGSEFPPLQTGTLRLYSMRLCPYAQRTRLVLVHKNIPHEVVNINLSKKPEWYLEKINPLGKVPALEKDGKIIYESDICCDYLDQVYPNNKLTPDDPYQQAKDRMLLSHYGQVTTQYYKFYFGTPDSFPATAEALGKLLSEFDKELEKRGKFFGGDNVQMIDFLVWPWIERFSAMEKLVNQVFLTDGLKPNLMAYLKRMADIPAVKKCMTTEDNHLKFYHSVKSGNGDYDIGLE
ncbi:glutathione S-transferase omega-1-like [Saccostrea echinata]|uniref:glutathione S-transferase omega-1-like n=1 Tax=Saccostrea echinata TaxID=191078 RepID=UPI002A7ECB24|nr:glutathione S-transferase omega-1-like [Saccostrea echinata]XP_061189961.1 glutathione S-transferase omega-1-like [Saccostrea echinata]